MNKYFMRKFKNYYEQRTRSYVEPSPGRNSPIFAWSPLPQKKQLDFTLKGDNIRKTNNTYYPNCDVNVWLRSCEKEIIEPIDGIISGTIPEWLSGTLIRNGPGSLKVGEEYFQHLFDSSALLHRFTISNGNITYQCRFLNSDVYLKNWQAKRIVVTEFGTAAVPDPCHNIFSRISSMFSSDNQSDNAMISVYPFGDELYAFAESPVIHRVNQVTLETEAKVDVRKHVAIVNHTSHPHIMEDGTVFNLAMSVCKTGLYHNIVCFPAKTKYDPDDYSMFEQAHIVASVPARWPLNPCYMHTFGVTDNFFVLVLQPLCLWIPALIKAKINSEPLAGCFRWYNNEETQIIVINRKSGTVTHTFYTEAFFYLHIINQYETFDHIVLDICSYRDPAMLDCMYIKSMKNMQNNPDYAKMFRGRPIRFVLPLNVNANSADTLKSGENLVKIPGTKAAAYLLQDNRIFVKPERLCNLGCETPRINYEKHLGKQYRYFYAISSDVDNENPGTIIKVDTYKKRRLTWCEKNCYPSEPIFVPKPNGTAEDDGVIMAAMVWGHEDTNHVGLIILDAKTFREIGRAEFRTESPVPKCLHGWFLPNAI